MFSLATYLRIGLIISVLLTLAFCFDLKFRERLESCPGFHSQLVVSPDGKTFITGDRAVIQWDAQSGQKLREFDFFPKSLGNSRSFSPQIDTLAIASNGKILAGSIRKTSLENQFIPKFITKNFISIWDITTGNQIQLLKENNEKSDDLIRFLSISPDNNTLICQTNEGVIKLLHLPKGQIVKKIEGKASQSFPIVISPDRQIFTSMHDDGTVKFWEMTTGKQLGKLKAHPSHTPLAISIDDKTLLIQNAGDVKRFRDIKTGAEIHTLGGSYIESAFATTPNGESVLIVSSELVHLYNMTTGVEIRVFQEISPDITELLVSPNGKTFLSVDSGGNYQLWDLKTGKKLFTLTEGWSRGENVFTPDSKTLINLSWVGNYITLWNLSDGKQIHQFCLNNP